MIWSWPVNEAFGKLKVNSVYIGKLMLRRGALPSASRSYGSVKTQDIENLCPASPDWVPFEERLATKAEVAAYFQVKVRTVDRWMVKGYLPYRKIGHHIRFRMGDLLAILDRDHRFGPLR